MVSDRAFIFLSRIPFGKTFSLALRSRSFVMVKVKYQGKISQKVAVNVICQSIQTQLDNYFFYWLNIYEITIVKKMVMAERIGLEKKMCPK